MTPEEARTKWCPHARQAVAVNYSSKKKLRWWMGVVTSNRNAPGGPIVEGCLCLATDCMAWRWYTMDSGYCGSFGSGEP